MKAVKWIIVVVVGIGALIGAYLWGRHSAPAAAESADAPTTSPSTPAPTASVTTVPLRRATIEEKLTAYGSVIAQPGEIKIISVPFESRVGHVLVTQGELIAKGTPLAAVEPSPDAQLQLREAKDAVDAAATAMQQAQQRFNEKLATNQDLATAQQTLQTANVRLQSLTARGLGAARELQSEVAGVIGKVDVQEGQIVPAGGPLVEIVVENRIEARLGIEPGEAPRVKTGQPVSLVPVNSPASEPVAGRIQLVTDTVNPDTRLVDIFASLAGNSHLMLFDYVRGDLTIAAKQALVVPRSAVLPVDGDDYTLFTVSGGHASRHSVRLGLQNGELVEVIGDGLKEGEDVVTVGNYELQDGMAVETGSRP